LAEKIASPEKKKEILPGWIIRVRETASGPVIEWVYCLRLLPISYLRIFPTGIMAFRNYGEKREHYFITVEALNEFIGKEYGWGEPPNLKEVYQHLIDLHAQKRIPARNKEEFLQISEELKNQWAKLAEEHRKDDIPYQEARKAVINRIEW